MIDWICAIFPVDFEIMGGRCVHLDENGEVEFTSAKFLQVEGSHSCRVSVKSIWDTKNPRVLGARDAHLGKSPYKWRIYVSGNPIKFLQGHNIWGHNDLQALMFCFMEKLCLQLQLPPMVTALLTQHAYTGNYEISRIDLTESFTLPTIGDVRAWIRAASQVGTGRNQSVNSYKERTLYLGKNSRRMSIKVYAKGDEIRAPKHRLPHQFDDVKEQLQEYTDKLLRVELTLRSMALKDMGLHKGAYWRQGMIEHVYNEKIKKLELPENTTLSAADVLSLPLHLQGYLALWQAGHNLKEHLGKRNYYKVRNEIKERTGVDIKSPPAGQKNNVVPLIKVITAEPAIIPDFAYEHDLVFEAKLRY